MGVQGHKQNTRRMERHAEDPCSLDDQREIITQGEKR